MGRRVGQQRGIRWLGGLVIAVAAAASKAASPSPPPTERVFVGHVVSTTLTTVPESGAQADGSVSLRLTCATAETTYEVLNGSAGAPQLAVVRSTLGEWCDMPAGIQGMPVLVDAKWEDGAWWEADAWSLDSATGDGQYVFIPATDPERNPQACGVKLWALRSPLASGDEIAGNVRELSPAQVNRLVRWHMARISADGTLYYTAAVRLDDLFDKLAKTKCVVPSGYPKRTSN